jgi:hypothetical protein
MISIAILCALIIYLFGGISIPPMIRELLQCIRQRSATTNKLNRGDNRHERKILSDRQLGFRALVRNSQPFGRDLVRAPASISCKSLKDKK